MAAHLYGFITEAQCSAVASGAKTRTIRRIGARRHAQPGDALRLYRGLRTKSAALLLDAVCVASRPVRLEMREGVLLSAEVDGAPVADLAEFARLDGFASADEMAVFFERLHGAGVFEGQMIEWAEA